MTNDFPDPYNSKIYGKEPRYIETLLQRPYFPFLRPSLYRGSTLLHSYAKDYSELLDIRPFAFSFQSFSSYSCWTVSASTIESELISVIRNKYIGDFESWSYSLGLNCSLIVRNQWHAERACGILFRSSLSVRRGVLPYTGYIGMCGPKGYGFSAVLVINWVSILAILPPFWS